MASSQLLHLLADAPQIEAPAASVTISATTPFAGALQTRLLDPAAPLSTASGASNVLAVTSVASNTKSMILGRWITKPLPAQTIGAGNWSLYAMLRAITAAGNDTITQFGMCLAQWRTGTGVVARFLDSPTTGTSSGAGAVGVGGLDTVQLSTVAGGALTLLAGDVLVLEVWFTDAFAASTTARTYTFLYGGPAEYTTGNFTYNTLPSFDPTLLAPAAITFS